jgi:flagellar basal-body rod modification protein FlgD
MNVTSASASAPSSSTSSTPSGNSSNNIFGTDNTQTFLQLLTTELQNQDPTSPMDPTQMVEQLVELENLNQTMSINQNVQQIANDLSGTSAPSSASSS